MAVAPFYLGARAGASPVLGTTLRAHYIADDGFSMDSICGHGTPYGWAPVAPGAGSTVTDLSLVTCGACLAALTQQYKAPSG